jgi:SAM-dependent methyltransferase
MNERFTARIAEAYGSYSQDYASILEPILRPMADEIASMSKTKSGEMVLDLATGTGLIARSIAQFADSVIGLDISIGVLEKARTLSAGEIPFVAGNGQRLPFGEGRFDLVTCGLSLSHFPDIPAALEEVRRVLRPWGRFLTSAWGSEGESPSKKAVVAVTGRFLEDRAVVLGDAFSEEFWADTEQGCETLRLAGFSDVKATSLQLSGEYRTPAEAVETALAWPLTQYRIARLDAGDRRRLYEETASAIIEVDDLRWRSEIHYYQATSPGNPRKSSCFFPLLSE